MGIAITITGRKREIARLDVRNSTAYNDRVANIKPKNMLPASPINILAGKKLNTKNPMQDPVIIKDSCINIILPPR